MKKDEGVFRLKDLKVKAIALVDRPAIDKPFYIVKREKVMEKVVLKNIEAINEAVQEKGASLKETSQQVRKAIEEILEKVADEGLKTALTQVMEIGEKGIEFPEYEIEEVEKTSKEDTPKLVEKKEKTIKDEGTSEDEKVTEVLTKSLDVLKDKVATLSKAVETTSSYDQLVGVVGGLSDSVIKMNEQITDLSKSVGEKADKSDVPVRKGVGPEEKIRPTEKELTEKEKNSDDPTSDLKKSERYQKAVPGDQLRMFLGQTTVPQEVE